MSVDKTPKSQELLPVDPYKQNPTADDRHRNSQLPLLNSEKSQ